YSVVFNDLINSANGPWTQMINEVFFGDDVDGAIANAQETMQSIIDQAPQK
ncbi:sugar ABC transporter substrate-binding protein, partial [Mesorhizobium sp. M7A.T.Ca.US.000.02.1.1]